MSPVSAGDVVDVYRARTGAPAGAADVLDERERERHERLFRPQDRNRYLTGHVLLRLAVADRLGIPVRQQRFVRRCLVCGGPHGTPRLVVGDSPDPAPGVHLNVSYSGRFAVVAVSEAGPVGVDVEQWERTDFAGFSTAALTQAEASELLAFEVADRPWARAVWWARKEAALKATGHGLRVDATNVWITPPDRPARLLGWTDTEVAAPTLRLADVAFPPGYACAVAVLGSGDLGVRVHDADDLVSGFDADGAPAT